jgi:uncharacterized protein YbjT (DUF2867 family)
MSTSGILVTGGTGTLGRRVVDRLRASGHEKGLVGVPLPGKAARAFREGAQLCPDRRYGTIRWEEFLREKVQRKPGEGTMKEEIS